MSNDALAKLKAQQQTTKDDADKSTDGEWQVFTFSRKATKVVLPSGKKAIFTEGRCLTKDPDVIEYLEEMVATNNAFGRADSLTNEEAVDPNIRLRLKIREEERAKLAASLDYSSKMGETEYSTKGASAKTANSAQTAS